MSKFLIVQLLMCKICGKASIQQNRNRIEKWAEQLSSEVNNVLEKNLGLSEFQNLIDQATYHTIKVDGSELLNNLSVFVDIKLKDVLTALISNKVKLESELFHNHRELRAMNCCMVHGPNEKLRNDIDRNTSCVIRSRKKSFLTEKVEENYKRNVLHSSAIKLQYFGSRNGSYHQYPRNEHRCSKEEIYDPRLRYVLLQKFVKA